MTTYIIDLRAKQITSQTRIWRMFPGFDYKYLESFRKDSAIFLDLPDLDLPSGRISQDSDSLKARLVAANAVRRWIALQKDYLKSSQSEEPPAMPSVEISDYLTKGWHRSYKNDLGAVTILFGEANKGDLVIVPDRLPTRQILIGEFVGGPGDRVNFASKEIFLDRSTPARKVSWFPAVNELRVPEEVSKRLRIPIPISLIPVEFYSTILGLSYGTYYRSDEFVARITISGSDFDSQATFDLGALAKLAALITASESGEDDLLSLLPTYHDVLVPFEFNPTISLNINSPGFGSLRSGRATPMIFAALFVLLAMGSAAETPKPADVTVHNSAAAADDKCTIEVDAAVKDVLARIGMDQWKALCERTQRLQHGAQVKVDSRGARNPK